MGTLSIEEKLKLIDCKIDIINVNLEWLNQNVGKVDEILDGKLSIQGQIDNFMLKKEALVKERLTLTNQG